MKSALVTGTWHTVDALCCPFCSPCVRRRADREPGPSGNPNAPACANHAPPSLSVLAKPEQEESLRAGNMLSPRGETEAQRGMLAPG